MLAVSVVCAQQAGRSVSASSRMRVRLARAREELVLFRKLFKIGLQELNQILLWSGGMGGVAEVLTLDNIPGGAPDQRGTCVKRGHGFRPALSIISACLFADSAGFVPWCCLSGKVHQHRG